MISNDKQIKKILWITLSNIGDVVLSTPVLCKIMEMFPQADITVIVGKKSAGVFEKDDRIKNIISWDKQQSIKDRWVWLKQVRNEKYDLVIDHKRTFWPLILGLKQISPLPLYKQKKDMHAVYRHLRVINKWNTSQDIKFYFPILEKHKKYVQDIIDFKQNDLLIGVACGAASVLKRWPVDKFIDLTKKLHEKYNCKFVLIGDQKDRELKWPESDYILDLRGKTSIKEMGAVLQQVQLLITNDSAPMHIAAALKTKTVAVFGPTDEMIYGPFDQEENIVRLNIKCMRCMRKRCLFEKPLCMYDLEVEEVILTDT